MNQKTLMRNLKQAFKAYAIAVLNIEQHMYPEAKKHRPDLTFAQHLEEAHYSYDEEASQEMSDLFDIIKAEAKRRKLT